MKEKQSKKEIEELRAVYIDKKTGEEILILAQITMDYSFKDRPVKVSQEKTFTLLANGIVIIKKCIIQRPDNNEYYYYNDMYSDRIMEVRPESESYSTFQEQEAIVQEVLKYKLTESLSYLSTLEKKQLIEKWKDHFSCAGGVLPFSMLEYLVDELNKDNQEFQSYRQKFKDNDREVLIDYWNEFIEPALDKTRKKIKKNRKDK